MLRRLLQTATAWRSAWRRTDARIAWFKQVLGLQKWLGFLMQAAEQCQGSSEGRKHCAALIAS